MSRTMWFAICSLLAGCYALDDETIDEGPVCGDGVVESGERCDDRNTASNDGCSSRCQAEVPIDVAWSVRSLAGGSSPCGTGNDTALINVTPYTSHACSQPPCDDDRVTGASGFAVACMLGKARVFAVQPFGASIFNVEVAITQGRTLVATSLPNRLRYTANEKSSVHEIYTDAGFVRAGWELRAAGFRTTCAHQGVTQARMTVTPHGGGAAVSFISTCPTVEDARQVGASTALAPGMYDLEVTAGAVTSRVDDIVVTPGAVTDVGRVVLEYPVN